MAYITNVSVKERGDSNWRASMPEGENWHVVENFKNEAQDFNQGAGGKYIYIFYQIDVSGHGVAALRFITGKGATPPAGWTKIDLDINKGAGGQYIYLCYIKNAEATYIERLESGYGISESSAFDDFGQNAVVLRQDTNKGAGGKYIYLGYYYNK